MRGKYRPHHILEVVLFFIALAGFHAGNSRADEDSKYLDAVREFADNVLKHGRDTYGPKHTPLFVDGLNIHTHEPVKWIAPNGDRWILSNLASQQNLFRTLDGLTTITGDPKYREAAMEAIEYAFENLRSPNGLFYWGLGYAYDVDGDRERSDSDTRNHSLRWHYPYYELMWEVTQDGLRDYVESFWAAHILNWSNLDMLRYAPLDVYKVAKSWNHEYRGGPVSFVGKGDCHHAPGSDLFYAAAILSKLSGEKEPLVWAKRMAHRYVETRDPNTGIADISYNIGIIGEHSQFADDFKGRNLSLFPFYPKHFAEAEVKAALAFQIRGWICTFLLGDLLGSDGEDFKRWALEELTAWGKSAYRKEDNAFIPMFTDGTSLEGYILKRDGYYGAKGTVYKAWHPHGLEFWAFALAYRMSGDEFMWEMARSIAKGNNFGDIGSIANNQPELEKNTNCSDPYALLSFLELHRKTGATAFLDMASRIGDNILTHRFHKGFFVPSKSHIYARFDAFEHLSLLHLFAAINGKYGSLPWVWPSESCFGWLYRQQQWVFDINLIYTLTDSPEPPISLHEVAAIGDLTRVKLLLSEGVDVNSRDRGMGTPLYRAVLNGHRQAVELLLAKGADVDAGNASGASVLHYAVEKGHKEIAELLIARGANINATREYPAGDTPLHSAARAGHKDIVELLIAKGAKINAKNSDGQTPMDVVAKRGRKELVKLLMEKGGAISTIYLAAFVGDLDKVKSFIGDGTDVNAKDQDGSTPLVMAVSGGHIDVVKFLIDKGADVNLGGESNWTPLHSAAIGGHKDVAELLLAKGADVNALNAAGYTPLYSAASGGHKDVAELLLAKGAGVNAKDKWGYTPLYYAIWRQDKDMVKLLVDKGADVNVLPNDDGTPLEYAVWNEDVEMAKLFVARGAKFYLKDNDGWTAFRYAASQGNRELVELFVAKGADVSTFHLAACMGDLARVKSFVEQGTDVDTKDEMDWTPLYWAASTGQRDVAEFLLAKGANVHAEANDNRTPLHSAASAGHREVVELLIAKGASIDARGRNNWTPLHRAARRGHRDVVEMLLFKGADVNAKDKQGRTALWYAEQMGYKEIAELLRKHGAKK